MNIQVVTSTKEHIQFVEDIESAIAIAARVKGTGLALRTSDYIANKIIKGESVIAITDDNEFAGFCYIETWEHNKFVINSGLIVVEKFRGQGLASRIKKYAFDLTLKTFPDAKLFGLTTSGSVIRINTKLGYKPVTLSELTDDAEFWKGCETCLYYDILIRTRRSNCLCTAMIYDSEKGK